MISNLRSSYAIAIRWIAQDFIDEIIGPGNGLVSSGNKPLPEPVMS